MFLSTFKSITNLTYNNFTSMSLKKDNQRSIALIYNLIFYASTKYIEIKYYDNKNEIVSDKIDL